MSRTFLACFDILSIVSNNEHGELMASMKWASSFIFWNANQKNQ